MPSSERVLGRLRPASGPSGPSGLSAPVTPGTAAASLPATTAVRPAWAGGTIIQARRTGPARDGIPAGLVDVPAARPVREPSAGAEGGPAALAGSQATTAQDRDDAARREAMRAAETRGFEAGFARGQAELRQAIQAAGAMAAQLESLAPQETASVAQSIAVIATAIARRIVDAELRTDPGVLVRSLESAVATINGSPEAHVLVHPDQLEHLRTAWEATHGTAYLGKRWTFEADGSLPAGGCVLRYDHGVVALGLEAQAQEIANAIADAFPGMPGAQAPIEADPE